jgi:hypothetical protein
MIVPKKNYLFDCDTINMKSFLLKNKPYKFILVVIDALSKYLYTVPLRTLTGKEMAEALESVLNHTFVSNVRTDFGTEFKNKWVANLLRDKSITYISATNETKASLAERVIKTLKSKITKYMDFKQTHRWIDILEDVTDAYNSSFHRTIQMTPKQALRTDDPTLWRIVYAVKPKRVKTEKTQLIARKNSLYFFKIAQHVKLSHLRSSFAREYQQRWTTEYFIIASREIKQGIQIYTIKSIDNKVILGSFYKEELQGVEINQNQEFHIEKILKRTRVNGKWKVLVHWVGWPAHFDSWLLQSDIRDL